MTCTKDSPVWPAWAKRGELSKKPKRLTKLTVKFHPQILKLKSSVDTRFFVSLLVWLGNV